MLLLAYSYYDDIKLLCLMQMFGTFLSFCLKKINSISLLNALISVGLCWRCA